MTLGVFGKALQYLKNWTMIFFQKFYLYQTLILYFTILGKDPQSKRGKLIMKKEHEPITPRSCKRSKTLF